MTVVATAAQLPALVGRHLGYSQWLEVTQQRVDRFAEAVEDRQWIHVDRDRARDSRFATTVAHGQLVLSLASYLLGQVLTPAGFAMVINYGFDRVRFLSPVAVGSMLRAGATLRSASAFHGGMALSVTLDYQVRGRRAPVCVANQLLRAYR